MMKRTVRSEFGEVYIREEGIVNARIFTGVEIDLERAKQYHSLVAYLSENKDHSTVVDLTGVKSISSEARKFLQKNSNEWGKTVAVALIVNSFSAKIMGNFFLTINRPNYPIKVFSDALEAHHWAKNEYLKKSTRMAS